MRNGRSKSRNGRNVECWNCDKTSHLKKNYRAPKKNEDKNTNTVNAVTDEDYGALLLFFDSSLDSPVIDPRASFHITAHCNVLENYLAGNHGKVYLADE